MEPQQIDPILTSAPQWVVAALALLAGWMKLIAPWLAERKNGPSPSASSNLDSVSAQILAVNERLDRHLSAEEKFQTNLQEVVTSLKTNIELTREELRRDRDELREELRQYRDALYHPEHGIVVQLAKALADRKS